MKTKVKACVVLNPRETQVIAGILTRYIGGKVETAQQNREEEKAVATDFLKRHEELQNIWHR